MRDSTVFTQIVGLGFGRLFDVVSSATTGTQEIVDSVATINGWVLPVLLWVRA